MGDREVILSGYGNRDYVLRRDPREFSADADLADRELLAAEGDAPARSGKPRQADKRGSGKGRGRKSRLEFEVPGERLGKARFGDPQHDWHCRIAGTGTERDLQVQGVDIGQGDEAVRDFQIAE